MLTFVLFSLLACVFYLYTNKINFLPLRSKGATERQFALLTTSEALAPPCSPKSIYRLAEAVRSRTFIRDDFYFLTILCLSMASPNYKISPMTRSSRN